MTELYPPLEPYANGFLRVSDLHEIYWEQCGNPDGVPIIVLHGGPGGGAMRVHRQFFDPDHYRIILFDQRGCGRSHPLRELRENTAAHLVSDIDALRAHLSIEQWHIFGGSWGSTLALHYSQAFPKNCLSLTLRGIFLCEQSEIDWFMDGMRNVFPEAWEEFAGFIPEAERGDLLRAYYKRLVDGDIEAAKRWYIYESSCSMLHPQDEKEETLSDAHIEVALNMSLLEAHYFTHEVISQDESLLRGIDKIRNIPAVIIQGRYDIVTPIETAYKLHKAWPEARLVIVPDAGHSALDTGICSALLKATNNLRN